LPAFDIHCPLGSLPRALRTEPGTIPCQVPYLSAKAERIARWRERLAEIPSPRIALAWRGNPHHPNDRNRSIPLSHFEPMLAFADLKVVSIQRDLHNGDAELIARLPRFVHVGGELDDFEDTAAVISLVDVVLSVDTSVAHLAGALGKPAWILLPFSPDWRWMLERDDSPWYPTVRLFRQAFPSDWAGAIEKVTDALFRKFNQNLDLESGLSTLE
jgi:hypothetical protein